MLFAGLGACFSQVSVLRSQPLLATSPLRTGQTPSAFLSSALPAVVRSPALVSRTESNTPLLGGGSVSHHSKTVSDATSTVHRHHTQATNPGSLHVVHNTPGDLLSTPAVISRQAALLQSSSPSLLQHADGRFFALNANLGPGDVFRTADGRTFALDNNAHTALAGHQLLHGSGGRTLALNNAALLGGGTGLSSGNLLVDGAGRTFAIGNLGLTGSNSILDRRLLTTAGRNVVTHGPAVQTVVNPALAATSLTSVRTLPDLTASAAVAGQRTHLLADSRTPVFQGFFSNPVSGVNFQF